MKATEGFVDDSFIQQISIEGRGWEVTFERRVEGGKGGREPHRSLEEDDVGEGAAGAGLAALGGGGRHAGPWGGCGEGGVRCRGGQGSCFRAGVFVRRPSWSHSLGHWAQAMSRGVFVLVLWEEGSGQGALLV